MTAVVLFVLAAVVAVGRPAEKDLLRLRPATSRRRSGRLPVAALAAVGLGLVYVLTGSRITGWVVAVAVVAGTAAWVANGTRAERRQVRERSDTARAARTLALLLQSGEIPHRALMDAASDCPVLAQAAATGRLGGDVVSALADLGRHPGRKGLLRVSAAWRVSERTGAPIALILAGVAENLRQERHLASVVAAELAAARASGRIMALLPFVAIAVGTLVGAHPVSFLLGSWLGELALLVGVVLAAAGVVWTEHISRSGDQDRRAGG